MSVTNVFTSGATVSHTQLNTNFSDVLNELGGLTVADLHAQSGILSTNLADRFAVSRETIMIAPYQTIASPFAVAASALPAAAPSTTYEICRLTFRNRTGKMAYLVDITISAQTITLADADSYPAVNVTRNGTQLGGGVAQMRGDTRTNPANVYRLANATPLDNPITSLADGDYISIQIGRDPDTATGQTTWAGAFITFTYKIELGA